MRRATIHNGHDPVLTLLAVAGKTLQPGGPHGLPLFCSDPERTLLHGGRPRLVNSCILPSADIESACDKQCFLTSGGFATWRSSTDTLAAFQLSSGMCFLLWNGQVLRNG